MRQPRSAPSASRGAFSSVVLRATRPILEFAVISELWLATDMVRPQRITVQQKVGRLGNGGINLNISSVLLVFSSVFPSLRPVQTFWSCRSAPIAAE